MQLELDLNNDHVDVIFTNNSKRDLRLWDLAYSWGHWSISFQISNGHDALISSIIHEWLVAWTVNGPIYFKLGPGELLTIPVNLNEAQWKRDQTLARLENETLSIRVSYHVDPTPEADEYEVFVGSAMSDWVKSEPPHSWLFARTSLKSSSGELNSQSSPEDVLKHLSLDIGILARDVRADAEQINRNPSVSSEPLEYISNLTVGHVMNNILDSTSKILKKIEEVDKYLEANTSRKR